MRIPFSQGYTIHRLLKEVWKTQEKIESSFIDSVANNLADYIYEIKDEFQNLSKIEIANLFSQQWINYLPNNDTKAILIAYRAYLDYYKGNYDKALEIVKEAEKRVERKDSKEYAEILTYQGSLNSRLKDKSMARKFHTQSFEMRKRLYPNQDHPNIANSLNNLVVIKTGVYLKKIRILSHFHFFNLLSKRIISECDDRKLSRNTKFKIATKLTQIYVVNK